MRQKFRITNLGYFFYQNSITSLIFFRPQATIFIKGFRRLDAINFSITMATPITKVCLFEIWTKRYVLTLLKQIEPINLFSHDMSVKMKSTLFFFDLIFIFRLQNIFSIETMLLVQLLT